MGPRQLVQLSPTLLSSIFSNCVTRVCKCVTRRHSTSTKQKDIKAKNGESADSLGRYKVIETEMLLVENI